jgi:hypothetical protein
MSNNKEREHGQLKEHVKKSLDPTSLVPRPRPSESSQSPNQEAPQQSASSNGEGGTAQGDAHET